MGKLGFFLLVIMVSVIVTSLIVNIHLLRVVNQLNDEIFFLNACLRARAPVSSPEEAIEVSKTTEFVREALSIYEKKGRLGALTVDVEHWNSSYIRHLKQQKYWKDTSLVKNLPEDHGVWRVHWHEKGSGDGVSILQFIDEQTGDILEESYATYG